MITRWTFILSFIFATMGLSAQCDIQSSIYSDGSMLYSLEPVKFYWTEAKELYGNVVTDQENYFLSLRPVPFPPKDEGKKLKKNLVLTLSNNQVIELSHYDTQYIENDSIMEILYLLKKDDVDLAHDYETKSVEMDFGPEGIRTYNFKLHKAAFRDQLDCLKNEINKK